MTILIAALLLIVVIQLFRLEKLLKDLIALKAGGNEE